MNAIAQTHDNTTARCMTVREFRDLGYLQEVNRQFLHPLGLALAVSIVDGREWIERIVDCRDDPEGIIFVPSDMEHPSEDTVRKAKFVQAERKRLADLRQERLGYVIQSITGLDDDS